MAIENGHMRGIVSSLVARFRPQHPSRALNDVTHSADIDRDFVRLDMVVHFLKSPFIIGDAASNLSWGYFRVV